MGIFGKSFEEKVQAAIEGVRGKFPGSQIHAQVEDEVVTLTGRAPDLETKARIMAAFNDAVETKNTINKIAIEQPTPQAAGAAPAGAKPAAAAPAAAEARVHTVVSGDTLSGLAKKYYGDASKYNRIFEANRDQLNDPDKIKVGQKLKIPT
ncbi:MAG TPA: LysM peptidoglycan-binding domain-containing protein [Thermoanaerobaculia bacterium]|jgi:nucleoid-associated protein YgaU|nr:LysM peptidoglycan-binding domain-containing protein [Thermoanaerobaculia bacterium]